MKPLERTSRATVRQVAERAGVSRMTVSNVIMGREDVVLPATRERVMEAVRALNYVPVRLTLQNRHVETRVIALALGQPEEIHWAINTRTYEGMCQSALAHGYDLLTLLRPNPDWAGAREDVSLLDRRSDGVIFATPIHEERGETLLALLAEGIPTVVCYRRDVPEGIAWVDPDNAGIVRQAIEHLAGLGHRHIAHLTDRQSFFDKRERTQLFLAEMKRLGLQASIVEAGYGETDLDFPIQAFEAVRATGATAVWALNDKLAHELWDQAENRGLSVPQDLSIVGVDDEPKSATRGLTTLAFSYTEIGFQAVEALVAMLRGDESQDQCKIVPVTLQKRASSGPVP